MTWTSIASAHDDADPGRRPQEGPALACTNSGKELRPSGPWNCARSTITAHCERLWENCCGQQYGRGSCQGYSQERSRRLRWLPRFLHLAQASRRRPILHPRMIALLHRIPRDRLDSVGTIGWIEQLNESAGTCVRLVNRRKKRTPQLKKARPTLCTQRQLRPGHPPHPKPLYLPQLTPLHLLQLKPLQRR